MVCIRHKNSQVEPHFFLKSDFFSFFKASAILGSGDNQKQKNKKACPGSVSTEIWQIQEVPTSSKTRLQASENLSNVAHYFKLLHITALPQYTCGHIVIYLHMQVHQPSTFSNYPVPTDTHIYIPSNTFWGWVQKQPSKGLSLGFGSGTQMATSSWKYSVLPSMRPNVLFAQKEQVGWVCTQMESYTGDGCHWIIWK